MICKQCGEERPPYEFAVAAEHKGKRYRRRQCRDCERVRYVRRNADSADAKRAFRETEPFRRKTRERKAQPFERMKRRVNKRARVARAAGEIVVPEICEGCGEGPPTEMHHEDYSQPLAVRHLCMGCHKVRHVEIRAAVSGIHAIFL